MSRPEVLDAGSHERDANSRESKEIDQLVDEVRTLSEQTDLAKANLYAEVGRLQGRLDSMRAQMSPEEGDYFDNRLDHVGRLIEELAGGTISSRSFEGDPKARMERALEGQQKLVDLVGQFGVEGLRLVEARSDRDRSSTVYGLECNGTYLGEFVVGTFVSSYEREQIVSNIMQLLAENGVQFTYSPEQSREKVQVSDVIDPRCPVRISIQEDGVRLLKKLNVFVDSGANLRGVLVRGLGEVRFTPETTRSVDVVVLDEGQELYTITLHNVSSPDDTLVVRGRDATLRQ